MGYLFGFIGTGNMGGALAKAACKGVDPAQVIVSNRTAAKAEALAAQLGCVTGDNCTVAKEAKYVFLGVKPQMMAGLMAEIAPLWKARSDRFILVTMAGGLSMEDIAAMAGGDYPIIRIMPNTPIAVGEGLVLYDVNPLVTEAETAEFVEKMAGVGMFDHLEEKLIDAGSCVAGCGPAFCAMFLEALSDGGTAVGLPRAKAMRYAAQMVMGTAALLLQGGEHPGAMKDAVCSPGGATIQGVRALERGGFRSAAFEAVMAAYEKTLLLGK